MINKMATDARRVEDMCGLWEVSASGYYAWLKRGPSRRRQADEALAVEVKRIHQASRKTY